jgi:Zn-dependent protease with chaperone function
VSPLQAQRLFITQAENNVLDRLVQAGLIAPPSDYDKILETVTNNVVLGSNLTLPSDIHCRVILTQPLESMAVGNTILLSKGLIDTLPTEEDLAAVLSFELAHIVLGHHIDTRYAFSPIKPPLSAS